MIFGFLCRICGKQQVCSCGKGNVSRFDLKESKEGFWYRGRRKLFHTEGPKPKNYIKQAKTTTTTTTNKTRNNPKQNNNNNKSNNKIIKKKKRRSAGPNSGKFGTRNMDAESIRSRAESTGGCVKLRTVTEIRRRSICDTFTAETACLVLNSLWDWN